MMQENVNDNPVQHARSDITIEFKRNEIDDPCKPYDKNRPVDKELSVGAQQGFGQLAGYVALFGPMPVSHAHLSGSDVWKICSFPPLGPLRLPLH
jgi:hypothetical protein